MTHADQRRWLIQERQSCLTTLNETMVIGQTILDLAREDLDAIEALLVTLDEEAALPLFTLRQQGAPVCPEAIHPSVP